MLNNQGFEKELNLTETTDDRQILNNLGGGSIASDIALFRNNLRNTSSLIWKYNTDSSIITSNKFIFPTTTSFIFTDGDEVKVQGTDLGNLDTTTTYYVIDFEVGLGVWKDQQGFSLSLTKGGSAVSLADPITADVEFIRRDQVTQENILNIASLNILEAGNDPTFGYAIGSSGTFSEGFNIIENNVSNANFAKEQKYVTNQSLTTSLPINIEGLITVEDPADTNTSAAALTENKSPGVYITDPYTSILDTTKIRAYSSSQQPWVESVDIEDPLAIPPKFGKLTTESTQVNIADLYFENGIKIDNIDAITSTTGTVNTTATQFTHKLPVKINGIDCFILVKKD
jgi:hypothetical protein